MPNCIYCGSEGPFTDEHVFPHALGGAAGEWLLTDCVCGKCNNQFSGMETNFVRRSLLALPRTVSGPAGRTDEERPDHQHQVPLYAQGTFVLQDDTDLLYEAGFSLGLKPYMRAQFIEVEGNVVHATAGSAAQMEVLVSKLREFFADDSCLTTFNDTGTGQRYKIYELRRTGEGIEVASEKTSRSCEGIWIDIGDEFIDRTKLEGRRYTPRVFLDNDDRLVVGSSTLAAGLALLSAVGKLLDERGISDSSLPATLSAAAQPSQVPAGTKYVTSTIYRNHEACRVIAKIGLNLVAKIHGADFARDPAFNNLRAFIRGRGFTNVGDEHQFARLLSDHNPFSYWKTGDEQHWMMLVNDPEGLAFVVQFYNHFVYFARLGPKKQGTELPIVVVNDFIQRQMHVASQSELVSLERDKFQLWIQLPPF